MCKEQKIPYFKYHPDPLKSGAFQKTDTPVICDICKQKTHINHSFDIIASKKDAKINGEVVCPAELFNGKAYEEDDSCYYWIVYICPSCFHNGKAHDKFGYEINDIYDDRYREKYTGIIDEDKIDELVRCTPGYPCCQHQVWPVHCNDFCAFVDIVYETDLKQMGILKEIKTYLREEGAFNEGEYGTEKRLKDPKTYAEGILYGGCEKYLFRCLHCGKYLLHYDYD